MKKEPQKPPVEVEAYYPFVGKIVNRYCFDHSNREDLFQSGVLGLLKAAGHYEPTYGTTFAAYAFPYIKGEILGALAQMKGEKKGFYRSEAKLLSVTPVATVPGEISGEEYAFFAETTLLADEEAELMFQKAETHLLVADIMKGLATEERKLLYYRYFLNLSQKDTGKYFQVSQSEISRREKTILMKLRKTV